MEPANLLTFNYDNLTCCSLDLHWNYPKEGEENYNSYKIYQKEGSENTIGNLFFFSEIYEGQDNNYKVINLKTNQQ